MQETLVGEFPSTGEHATATDVSVADGDVGCRGLSRQLPSPEEQAPASRATIVKRRIAAPAMVSL